MTNNKFIKLLCSIPIILVFLYFIPFLGVCLILLRYFIYDNKKRVSTQLYIIAIGILLLIPKLLKLVLDIAKIDINKIPYLKDIINTELYNVNFINYSKRLICVGIIFLIVSFVLKTIFDKVSSKLNSGVRNYINENQKRNDEILRKNDMEIKVKQEKIKNTAYVKCPKCGSDNLLGEKFGTCKYCRSKLENKEYKN